MGCRSLFLVIFKPTFFNGGLDPAGRLALDLNLLGFVSRQIVNDVGFFGRGRRLRDRELLNMGLGVTRFGRRRLVGAELAQVQLLDGVRCGCRSLGQRAMST
jgi:hypothetical protein